MIKFSIVTVTYNAQEFIEKTINSVIEQNYPYFEYIIVDGASNDKTMELVKKYSDKITKIISEPDQGIYDAMNKGIHFCQGDFIYFLNAGDVFTHSNLLTQVAEFYKNNFSTQIIYGDIDLKNFSDRWIINEKTYKGKIKNTRYLFNNMFCQQRAFFNKSIFTSIGNFDTSYKVIADYDLIFRAYQKGLPFGYLNKEIVSIPLGGYSNYHLDQFLFERLRTLRHIPFRNWWWFINWMASALMRGSLGKYFRLKLEKSE